MTGITGEARNKGLTSADLCASCRSALIQNRLQRRVGNRNQSRDNLEKRAHLTETQASR